MMVPSHMALVFIAALCWLWTKELSSYLIPSIDLTFQDWLYSAKKNPQEKESTFLFLFLFLFLTVHKFGSAFTG